MQALLAGTGRKIFWKWKGEKRKRKTNCLRNRGVVGGCEELRPRGEPGIEANRVTCLALRLTGGRSEAAYRDFFLGGQPYFSFFSFSSPAGCGDAWTWRGV